MKLDAFEAVARALDGSGVRYLAPGVTPRFVSVPALIAMKETADRPSDRVGVEYLRRILEEDGGDD